ncbi:response regulator [Nostoc sp.]|uniref:response regulator n=1 Tax=Nostoc sp. TaxID=1180 RepID=UPI002FF5332B
MMVENFEPENSLDERTGIDINIFKGLAVLILDDDKNILVLTSYVFKRYGIQAMITDNASSAFELVQKTAVDHIFWLLAHLGYARWSPSAVEVRPPGC